MNLLALDFDGVICDSAAETAVTAWRAGRQFWPEWQTTEPPIACLTRFRELRVLLETGYQAIPLMRLAWQGLTLTELSGSDFADRIAQVMTGVNADRKTLIRLFGQTRDQWIRTDLNDWLARHQFYPGTVNWLNLEPRNVTSFILTTKQKRFVQALLAANQTVFAADRIHGLEDGRSKAAILLDLSTRPEFAKARCHLVEDRLETLEQVAQTNGLENVQLYLATWGYNTPAERARAVATTRIQLLDHPDQISFLLPLSVRIRTRVASWPPT